MAITRGFARRGAAARDPRLLRDQYDVGDGWPVLHAGATPSIRIAGWTCTVDGLVMTPGTTRPSRSRVHTGCTTNLPIKDVTGGKAWVVRDVDETPLQENHGGPARLPVPHPYFWKSAKWVPALTRTAEDQPGLWEQHHGNQGRGGSLARTALPGGD